MAGSVISILHDAAAMWSQSAKREEPSRPRGGGWKLDRTALNALLKALDTDRDRASKKYTALHDRLIRFFQWNKVEDAQSLADETLDRLARRVAADTAQEGGQQDVSEAVQEPEKFAAGIARLLLHEHWRRQQRETQALQLLKYDGAEGSDAESQQTEALAAALDECLEKLPPGQRELIQRYYGSDGYSQIESRKQLAAQMNISLNALRNRAMRIRADLEGHAAAALRKSSDSDCVR
jgi:DNA-directed RNA polymerase specialized sigma24 family protein